MNDNVLSPYDADFRRHWETFADDILRAFDRSLKTGDQRERYVVGLFAVAKLLRRVNPNNPSVYEIADQFHSLADAIQDLVNGISHPFFKKARDRRAGRPPDASKSGV